MIARPPLAQPAPRLALSAPEAAAALSISERTLRSETTAGRVPHVRIGGRIVYPVAELQQWLSRQAQTEGEPQE